MENYVCKMETTKEKQKGQNENKKSGKKIGQIMFEKLKN